MTVLTRKPGALSGSTALVTARATKAFTPAHQQYWDAARKALGDGAGTRALIGVLLLHRTLPADTLTAGMATARASGRFDADLVAVHARTWASGIGTPPPPVPVPGAAAPAAGLTRPAPSLTGYDQLIGQVGA